VITVALYPEEYLRLVRSRLQMTQAQLASQQTTARRACMTDGCTFNVTGNLLDSAYSQATRLTQKQAA
jgi:hypothetical protein